jgi:hypothetical protein
MSGTKKGMLELPNLENKLPNKPNVNDLVLNKCAENKGCSYLFACWI